ncbi:DNA-binding SARP family transcriptional activator [Actinocorallia herbida]|uniref:DNA-binding SARP family transcriptional activator n=1 Tax=Actinocorallia herbida TaxID=58109 RepID=A0A3N1CXX7_9ACTN|nr:BTAD domain-containing putative transcriptional regulator [Actinocorallia herbida]ROO86142.1 DNA-binding SARP family transcriptional activator [Actinocorallia herbida]
MDMRVLGPVEVWRDGAAIDVGSPKQRTVLALLAAVAPRPVSVDRLIEEIWEGSPPPRPLGSLQVYVSNLRRALEPARRPGAPATVLVTAPPGYALRVDERLDRVRFERAAALGHDLLAAGDNTGARGALAEALDLWRGEPYADVPVAALGPETERLLKLRMLAAEDLWAAEVALGRHRAAVPALRRLAVEHPLRERVWELLVVALYRSGHQAEALSALREVRLRLADDLGIDPGPALRALETDVLRQAPHLDPPPVTPPPRLPTAGGPPGAGSSGFVSVDGSADAGPSRYSTAEGSPVAGRSWPTSQQAAEPAEVLVGRADPLAALVTAGRTALAGRGGIVVVSGEPGIGKSRLLREFTRPAPSGAARPRPITVAGDPEGTPPWHGWHTVLAGLGAALPDTSGTDPDVARWNVVQTVRTALAAAPEPVALVFDDLQWLDSPSLQVLAALADTLPDLPCCLLAATRDTPPADGPLAAALAALTRAGATRLTLHRFTLTETHHYVRAVTALPLPADQLAALHTRTEGNPLFLREMTRLLAETARPGATPAPTGPAWTTILAAARTRRPSDLESPRPAHPEPNDRPSDPTLEAREPDGTSDGREPGDLGERQESDGARDGRMPGAIGKGRASDASRERREADSAREGREPGDPGGGRASDALRDDRVSGAGSGGVGVGVEVSGGGRGLVVPGDLRGVLAGVPEGIRDVVRVRVAALPEEVRGVLQAAAVLGQRVDVELLGRVCGLDPEKALDLVDVAVIHRVLEEDAEAIGQVRFGHALVRDAILADLRPGRRAALHLKAADALAEDGGPAAALAAHLDGAAARMPRLAGRAVRAAEDAAAEASARNAPIEAARWRERALRLAETDRELDHARRHALLVALAAARRDASDVAGAREAMLAAVGIAEELRDEKGVAEALVAYGAATAPVWPGPFPDPVVLHRMEASAQGLDALDDGLGGLLLACLAAETAKTGDVPGTRAVSARAVARARAAGDVGLLARILGAHLVTTWAADTVETRIEQARELAALPAGPAAEALGRWFAGVSLLEAGRRRESRAEVERSGRLAERLGLPALLAQQGWFAAMESFVRGDLAAAEAATDRAAALHRSTGMWGADESVASQLFALRDEQDRLPELVPALTAVADAGMPGMIEGAALGLLRAGDLRGARDALDRAFADPPLPAWGLVHSWAVRAEVCAAVGSPAQVAEAERVLAPHAARIALAGTGVLCRGSVVRLLGLLAERRGDLPAAEAALRSAVALEDDTGLTLWAAHSRVALARVLRLSGTPSDAEPSTLLDQAATTRGLRRLTRTITTARSPDPTSWW